MNSLSFSLDNVCSGYGKHMVLDHISGVIRSGKMTVFIGPNGSGKTTMLKTMAGVLPFDGRISLMDRDLAGYPSAERGRIIGFAGQTPVMNSPFSVFEVVLMGRLPYINTLRGYSGTDRRKALAAASAMRLEDMLQRSVSALSGGEKQRVALAQVLAQDTEVLLLDEPSSALDPNHTLDLFSTLRDLAAAGRSVVLSVHDINLAARFADDLWVLKNGKLLARGAVDEILGPDLLFDTYDVPFTCYRGEENNVWHVKEPN